MLSSPTLAARSQNYPSAVRSDRSLPDRGLQSKVSLVAFGAIEKASPEVLEGEGLRPGSWDLRDLELAALCKWCKYKIVVAFLQASGLHQRSRRAEIQHLLRGLPLFRVVNHSIISKKGPCRRPKASMQSVQVPPFEAIEKRPEAYPTRISPGCSRGLGAAVDSSGRCPAWRLLGMGIPFRGSRRFRPASFIAFSFVTVRLSFL